MPSAPPNSATANGGSELRPGLYALAALGAVALLLTGLLVTRATDLAPDAYIIAATCWLVGSAAALLTDQRRGIAAFNPLMLFFAVVAATYTIHAIDAVPPQPSGFNPNQPDDLPGIYTNFTPYYLILLAAVVLIASWYGSRRERETETGIAVLIVYTSLAFEHMLRSVGNELDPAIGSLSATLLWAPLLVLFAMWRSDALRGGRTWRWTSMGGPLMALVAAGLISTVFSVYTHASLLMLLRIAAFSSLLLLVANTVVSTRQVRLYWVALTAPLAVAALVIVIKLWDINANMGTDFVLSLRYQISGVAGTNPAGLSLGIGTLLVIAAMIVQKDLRLRAALALLLIPLVPAFFATHSPSGLVALGLAIAGLVFFRYGYQTWRGGPKRIAMAAAGTAVVVVLLGLVVLVPNPYTGKISGDVTDPTTGRSVRDLVWGLAIKDFRDDPLTGVGLQNYYARTKHVDEFPAVDAMRVGERRLLVEGTGEPWKPYVTSHPHNSYLAVLETMGLPGLLAMLWLGGALAVIAWRVFLRADGSFWWWTSAVSLAGVGMALSWNFVAQGEDVTIIALPFFPSVGLAVGALGVLEPETTHSSSPIWNRAFAPIERWWNSPVRQPVLGGLTALVFVLVIARPVAAEILVQKSDEAANVDNPRALQMMRWATRLSPISANYHRRLSDAYMRTGRYPDALDEQKNVLDVRSGFAPDEAHLGWLYWFGRDLDSAVAVFQRAVDDDRWDVTRADVHMSLGLGQAANGNYQGALDTFAYGFSVSPSMLLDDAWAIDDSSEPPVTYLDSTYLQPVDPNLPESLQRALIRRLDLQGPRAPHGEPGPEDYRLIAVLDRMARESDLLVSADPERAEAILATSGELALKAGLPDRAAPIFEELSAAHPEDEIPYYSLGLAYYAMEDYDEAKQAFQKVIDLADDESIYVLREPFSHFYLGAIALNEQPPDLETARRELNDAVDTYRWSYMPDLYPYLALAEGLSGDTRGAQDDLDKELFLLNVDEGGDPFPDQPLGETVGAIGRWN